MSYKIFYNLMSQGLTLEIDEKKVKYTGNAYMSNQDFKVYTEYEILKTGEKKYFNQIELFSNDFMFFYRPLGVHSRVYHRVTDYQ